ncbi:hypothetical protein BaRGS_00025497, partial [Batillaria attramentaria]
HRACRRLAFRELSVDPLNWMVTSLANLDQQCDVTYRQGCSLTPGPASRCRQELRFDAQRYVTWLMASRAVHAGTQLGRLRGGHVLIVRDAPSAASVTG